MNHVYGSYRASARRRNIPFELQIEDFKRLGEMYCTYCGAKPSNKTIHNTRHYNGDWTYNGIDRRCNEKGYTLENSQPCCFECNQAKSKKGEKEFLQLVVRIYRFLKLEEFMDDELRLPIVPRTEAEPDEPL